MVTTPQEPIEPDDTDDDTQPKPHDLDPDKPSTAGELGAAASDDPDEAPEPITEDFH